MIDGHEDRKSQPTHIRLYELNKERMNKQVQAVLNETEKANLNATQLNKTSQREKPLQESLYEDAERRRTDNAAKKKELDRTRDIPKEKKF